MKLDLVNDLARTAYSMVYRKTSPFQARFKLGGNKQRRHTVEKTLECGVRQAVLLDGVEVLIATSGKEKRQAGRCRLTLKIDDLKVVDSVSANDLGCLEEDDFTGQIGKPLSKFFKAMLLDKSVGLFLPNRSHLELGVEAPLEAIAPCSLSVRLRLSVYDCQEISSDGMARDCSHHKYCPICRVRKGVRR